MYQLSGKNPLGLYEKALEATLTWSERLDAVKEMGFDFLEISIDETDLRMNRVLNRSEDHELREAITKTGIPISTMCLSGHRRFPIGSLNREIEDKGMELMRKAIEFSVDFGVRIIQLAGYDIYYDEVSTPASRQKFLQNLQTAVDWAAQAGVILAFETMGAPHISTIGKAMEYVSFINSPYLQVYADMGNLSAFQADVGYEIKIAKKHLVGMHIKDTKHEIFRDIPFGEGSTPFIEAFKALKKSNFKGFYVMEMWNIPGENNKEIISQAKRWVENKMEESGM